MLCATSQPHLPFRERVTCRRMFFDSSLLLLLECAQVTLLLIYTNYIHIAYTCIIKHRLSIMSQTELKELL